MARRIAYRGTKFTVAFAREKNGDCPGGEFFDSRNLSDKLKLMALFERAGDLADFRHPEKFGDLGDGLYELKSFQIRMPFAYAKKERGMLLITHGFIKKKNKTPREEIDRARRILEEDQASSGLTLVQKKKT
jgi:phage-related protein